MYIIVHSKNMSNMIGREEAHKSHISHVKYDRVFISGVW